MVDEFLGDADVRMDRSVESTVCRFPLIGIRG